MASTLHPTSAFAGSLASKASASDLLCSSRNGVCGVPLKALGKARLGSKKRDFVVSTKLRKFRKHDYPWPQDPDPNVKGGPLRHLSPFKPLKEKPKPVILDFEKPLIDLQKQINSVQKLSDETGVDMSAQIRFLEKKYEQERMKLYTDLTPIQRVYIARHPNRPTFLDHIFNITERFVELHGDRAGYDDPAVVTGLGSINGRSFMFIGQQKGRNTKENIQRNFAMPTPHGYRKALRMMRYADHHGFPIVTFIDTPGAYADMRSEELGQGEAIAQNLRTMFGLKVPIISIVIGEGGSGGALAIGCGNKLLMLENAVFYVASPEACAAILWKSAKEAPKAARRLKITAQALCKMQIADSVIPEPLGGAHADPEWTSQQIKTAILESMEELDKMNTEELTRHRMLKFRKIGADAGRTPPKNPLEGSEYEKLRMELNYEYSQAAKALGYDKPFRLLMKVYPKTSKSNPLAVRCLFLLLVKFHRDLPAAPNYEIIKSKRGMLEEIKKAHKLLEKSNKVGELKQELNKKVKEIVNRGGLKKKIEALKVAMRKPGLSRIAVEKNFKYKVVQLQSEIESELITALDPSLLDTKVKLDRLKKEIDNVIEGVMNSTDLKKMINLLKSEIAKAAKRKTTDPMSEAKILRLKRAIKQRLTKNVKVAALRKKHDKLKAELSEAVKSYIVGSDGNGKAGAGYDESKAKSANVEVNCEANRSFA